LQHKSNLLLKGLPEKSGKLCYYLWHILLATNKSAADFKPAVNLAINVTTKSFDFIYCFLLLVRQSSQSKGPINNEKQRKKYKNQR
jgi:hypothetical protein